WDVKTATRVSPPIEIDGASTLRPQIALNTQGTRVGLTYRCNMLDRSRSGLLRPASAIIWSDSGDRLFSLPNKITSAPIIHGKASNDGLVVEVAFDSELRNLVAGVESSGEVSYYSIDRRQRLYQKKAFRGFLMDLAFSDSGDQVLLASSDNQVRVLNSKDGSLAGPALRHSYRTDGVVVDADATRAVTITKEGRIRLWQIDTGDLVLDTHLENVDSQRPCWLSLDGSTIVFSQNQRYVQMKIPRYAGKKEHAQHVVHLVTGRRFDGNNGFRDLWNDELIRKRKAYRTAWLAWVGLSDDPTRQP
ncbi:MAG: WD40 repeat domain-containing protein, partial [Planctomycetota bacterium]